MNINTSIALICIGLALAIPGTQIGLCIVGGVNGVISIVRTVVEIIDKTN